MKISKHIHSCLLVEDLDKVFLIDPGNYTFEYSGLNVNSLTNLDYILITHEHPDHMDIGLIKKLLEKFPQVKVISNKSVSDILVSEGISITTSGDQHVEIDSASHERVFDKEPPENIVFKLNSKLTHPGDSHHFSLTTPILALPVQAPWGSLTNAVNLALNLKPEVIIPIHDWHWNDIARDAIYKRLESFFETKSIRFIPMETGKTVEV